MVAPIPPMLKYSIVYNLLNFPQILIKFVSKFIVCNILYFKAQYLLRLRSPLSFRGMDTVSGETTLSKLFYLPSMGSKFFLLRDDPSFEDS